MLGDEIIRRTFGYDVVLNSASSYQAAYEWMYAALAAVDMNGCTLLLLRWI